MADEFPLGTDALRRNVAAARAVSGANTQPDPAPDPFGLNAPWMQPTQPVRIEPVAAPARNGATPVRPTAPISKVAKPKAVKIDGKLVEPPDTPEKKHRRAWQLVHKIMKEWAKEAATSVAKADLHLAQKLMENGALLLRFGLPMDNLGQMIRLARDLAHNADKEGDTNTDVDELRDLLERSEESLPPLEAHNEPPPEDEEEGL